MCKNRFGTPPNPNSIQTPKKQTEQNLFSATRSRIEPSSGFEPTHQPNPTPKHPPLSPPHPIEPTPKPKRLRKIRRQRRERKRRRFCFGLGEDQDFCLKMMMIVWRFFFNNFLKKNEMIVRWRRRIEDDVVEVETGEKKKN